VLRTLPKKGESLTTVCAAEAEPTYEKTGAGALVDILSLRAHRSHFTAPEFRICAFRALSLSALLFALIPLPPLLFPLF
jgi:hypothetical protein